MDGLENKVKCPFDATIAVEGNMFVKPCGEEFKARLIEADTGVKYGTSEVHMCNKNNYESCARVLQIRKMEKLRDESSQI